MKKKEGRKKHGEARIERKRGEKKVIESVGKKGAL